MLCEACDDPAASGHDIRAEFFEIVLTRGTLFGGLGMDCR